MYGIAKKSSFSLQNWRLQWVNARQQWRCLTTKVACSCNYKKQIRTSSSAWLQAGSRARDNCVQGRAMITIHIQFNYVFCSESIFVCVFTACLFMWWNVASSQKTTSPILPNSYRNSLSTGCYWCSSHMHLTLSCLSKVSTDRSWRQPKTVSFLIQKVQKNPRTSWLIALVELFSWKTYLISRI